MGRKVGARLTRASLPPLHHFSSYCFPSGQSRGGGAQLMGLELWRWCLLMLDPIAGSLFHWVLVWASWRTSTCISRETVSSSPRLPVMTLITVLGSSIPPPLWSQRSSRQSNWTTELRLAPLHGENAACAPC